ncbi:MAG TPA: TIR domain-containing protein [Thermoplasmata archaeon]|nr:TIR domain-containing protein [Thermoplasmata archaeon]
MDLAEVRHLLEKAGIKVVRETRNGNNSGYRLECSGGEIVIVYDSGKVVAQGAHIRQVAEVLGLSFRESLPVSSGHAPRPKVFVVYGHDVNLKHELEALLRRWDLEPVILDQLPSAGTTVIEKLETYIAINDVRFGIVLATPDDEGFPRGSPDAVHPRVRQNVVLELGMLLMKLGRSKVAILLQEGSGMEKPSDIEGLIYIGFKSALSEVQVDLIREMHEAGVSIDVGKI